jgi:uncharacterized RDD family membrane protein YckC
MKCPKCGYLGFETGDRCKHCGYDFSLMTPPPAPLPDLIDSPPGDTLPLFMPPGEDDDDEPLIKLPVAPRAPLAVRKTPDLARSRAASRPPPRGDVEPVLEFADEIAPFAELDLRDPAEDNAPVASPRRVLATAGSPGARLGAALIDHVILFAIDAAVLYFTLRMAALPALEWRLLPPVPLLAFLGLVKFAYFCAFTAVGGQTIGKMALGIRVVTDDNAPVDGVRAIRRTIAGIAALLGLGFIPALVGSERRAFHDRVAHTRVVALRSA